MIPPPASAPQKCMRVYKSRGFSQASPRGVAFLNSSPLRPKLSRGLRAPHVGGAREPDCWRGAGPARDPGEEALGVGTDGVGGEGVDVFESVGPGVKEEERTRRQAQGADRSCLKSRFPAPPTPGQPRPEIGVSHRPGASWRLRVSEASCQAWRQSPSLSTKGDPGVPALA